MKVSCEQRQSATLMTVVGSFDGESVRIFKEAANKIINDGCYTLVVDLKKVPLIDSLGLGALIALLRKVRAQKGAVKICGLNKDIENVFRITRLLNLFEIYDSVEATGYY